MRVWTITQSGSPPRMRGKGLSDDGHFVAYRITPAYAGKSFRFFILEGLKEDHPRICGEKGLDTPDLRLRSGSPPHMRGKVARNELRALQYGITPAYAGKRLNLRCDVVQAGDHPRICGEKYLVLLYWDSEMGSPPHMRGKERKHRSRNITKRITPAYAGKS